LSAEFDLLEAKGIERRLLWEQALITPSCGLGPIAEERTAEEILLLTSGLSQSVRQWNGEK
jgi:hypothetical protein